MEEKKEEFLRGSVYIVVSVVERERVKKVIEYVGSVVKIEFKGEVSGDKKMLKFGVYGFKGNIVWFMGFLKSFIKSDRFFYDFMGEGNNFMVDKELLKL